MTNQSWWPGHRLRELSWILVFSTQVSFSLGIRYSCSYSFTLPLFLCVFPQSHHFLSPHTLLLNHEGLLTSLTFWLSSQSFISSLLFITFPAHGSLFLFSSLASLMASSFLPSFSAFPCSCQQNILVEWQSLCIRLCFTPLVPADLMGSPKWTQHRWPWLPWPFVSPTWP